MDKILETIETDYKGQAVDNNGCCVYLTKDNKKCAIGLFMNHGKHQYYTGVVEGLLTEYKTDCIHTLPTNNVSKLKEFQVIHDDIEDDQHILGNHESFKDLSIDEQKMMLQFSALYLFEDEL